MVRVAITKWTDLMVFHQPQQHGHQHFPLGVQFFQIKAAGAACTTNQKYIFHYWN